MGPTIHRIRGRISTLRAFGAVRVHAPAWLLERPGRAEFAQPHRAGPSVRASAVTGAPNRRDCSAWAGPMRPTRRSSDPGSDRAEEFDVVSLDFVGTQRS